ncbi:hypothetical protein A33K_18278 [Burkholderia humptydooensis MSMB43]|uniref:Uncharacterized protein n=1 Tax=Burkholderia humptydooensis MSMB43 TaxID=441157 RepID=A0ABN0FYD9_9BURK|nr:hypothetical protein A33K_18278 [Burkholderia humptydooensis MSMB43]
MLFVLSKEPIHFCDFVQHEEASPQNGRAGWPVMLAIQIAAQHGYPQHGLLQGWDLLWQLRGVLCLAIQCLPFNGLQQHLARQFCVDSRQHGRIQNAPTNDGKQGGCSDEPIKTPKLSRLDLASAFQYAMPRFNGPTTCIPGQPLKSVIKCGRFYRTQQHPLDRLNAVRRSIFDCVNRKHIDFRQPSCASSWRLQSYRRATQRQACRTLREIVAAGHQQFGSTQGHGSLNGLPQIPLGMACPAIDGRANQPVHACGTLYRKQLVQIALTVTDADEARFGTTLFERGEMRNSLDPFGAFLLMDRTGFALMLLTEAFIGPYPRLHSQQPQRQAFWSDSQQAVHHETALMDAISRTIAQPFRCWKMRQVEFRCVLYGQHDWNLGHPVQRLCYVRREDAVGVDLRIVEKAICGLKFGCFEGLWKRALRTAGEAPRQGNETPPQTGIAQVRRTELRVCPIVNIVHEHQSRIPLTTDCVNVNSDVTRLQAIFASYPEGCG